MSVALVTKPEDCDPSLLVVACAESSTDGHNARGVGIHDHRRLVAHLLASRTVALVPAHGPRIFLHPRRQEEPAASWLARVLRVIVNEADVSEDCTDVVLEAIAQLTGSAPSLVRYSHVVADDLETERLLVADADSAWLVRGVPADADLDALLATLAFALVRRPRSAEDTVVRDLASAVAAADPDAFTRTVAGASGGQVRLRLATGDIVSEHTAPTSGNLVQEVMVRTGEAISGSVEVRRATRQVDPETLTALAAAMLSVIRTNRSREELENEVAVLSCLVDLDTATTRVESGARRLVLITPPPGTTFWALTALRARIRSAAAGMPLLESLAIACTRDQRLIGAYADPDCGVNEHRKTWEQILAKADTSEQLRALISTPIRRHEEVRRNLCALERLGEWCAADSTPASTGRATMADDVGPLWSSLDVWPADRVGPYVESVLGSLARDDRFGGQLTDTLHAYLQSNGSLRGASERLHLHSSTVRYRMRILRDQLGDRLINPEKRFELELALRLHLARRATQQASVGK